MNLNKSISSSFLKVNVEHNKNILIAIILILVVLSTLVVIIQSAEPLRDGDIWFHLTYGKWFVEQKTLISDHSVFSWTPVDNTQIYCAWFSQLILFYLYKLGGLSFLFMLRYLGPLVFIVSLLIFARRQNLISQPLIYLICIIGLFMARAAILIKPEMFSFLMMTLVTSVWFHIKKSEKNNWQYLYIIPLIFLLWVNMHGGFIFGLFFIGLVLIGEVLNWVLLTRNDQNSIIRKHSFIIFLLSGLTVFLTPYGLKYPQHLFNTLIVNRNQFLDETKTVMAYQSIFHPLVQHFHFIDLLIISCIILIALIVIRSKKQGIDWTILIPNLGLALLYVKFLRTTYFWAPMFAFSSVYLLSTIQTQWMSMHRNFIKAVNVIIIIFFIAFVSREIYQSSFLQGSALGVHSSPIEEARFVRDNFKGLRLGNDYNMGAYLMWALWPEMKIFIDARYFPYHEWYPDYLQFSNSMNIDELINKYKCDVWCLSLEFPALSYFIESNKWHLVHYGPSACIFISKEKDVLSKGYSVSESVYNIGINEIEPLVRFSFSIGDLDTAFKVLTKFNSRIYSPLKKVVYKNCIINVGKALEDSKRYFDAINLYNHFLMNNPGVEEFHFNIANSYARLHLPDRAIEHYQAEISINPDSVKSFVSLGNMYMVCGKFDDAIKAYQKALLLDPNCSVDKNIKIAQERKTKLDHKINTIKKAIKIYPSNPQLHFQLGDVYKQVGNNKEAISEYEKVVQLNKNYIPALQNLAILYSKQENYDASMVYLKNILAIDPQNVNAMYNIACLFAKKSDVNSSVIWLQKAIDKGFNNWELLTNDNDLENIRSSSFYKHLLDKYSL